MKIRALMKRKIAGQVVESMTNDTYKKISNTILKEKITQIKKRYSDSLSEAGKFYVR